MRAKIKEFIELVKETYELSEVSKVRLIAALDTAERNLIVNKPTEKND